MTAVYPVETANAAGFPPFHVTVPVYCAVSVIAITGVSPAAGAVTPAIAARLMTVGAVLCSGGSFGQAVIVISRAANSMAPKVLQFFI
jgi:phage tail tape-measure protein